MMQKDHVGNYIDLAVLDESILNHFVFVIYKIDNTVW